MFIGSISQDVRIILAELAGAWKDRPIYVGCSGNFTVERIMSQIGFQHVHGNDVSLYTCALGAQILGRPFRLEVQDDRYRWIEPYLQPGPGRIAAVLLLGKILEFDGRTEPYHQRMLAAHRTQFDRMHEQTVARLEKALEGVRLESFFAGDVMDLLARLPEDAVFTSFPPTYTAGYEKLYKKLEATLDWDRPTYQIFTEESFGEMVRQISQRDCWLLARDHEIPELTPYMRGITKSGMRSKPIFIYAADGKSRLRSIRQKTESLPIPRFDLDCMITADSRLSLAEITGGQMNLLRSEYLSPKIIPAGAQINLAVLVDGKLIGALGYARSRYGMGDLYQMTDFAIRPTNYRRLSKLVLAASLSREVKALAEQKYASEVRSISTTAFTERAASMKYRGLFEVYNRKEGVINYIADAGQWSLQEGFAWWWKRHSTSSSESSTAN